MNSGWLLASLHLLTLGIGFGFCWMRGYALRNLVSTARLKPVFVADNLYGIAALLWIITGLLRAFGGYAKGRSIICRARRSGSRWACSGWCSYWK